ncbi:MAG: ankyrin repeat domain-containing protein [Armatimonadota bacterium]
MADAMQGPDYQAEISDAYIAAVASAGSNWQSMNIPVPYDPNKVRRTPAQVKKEEADLLSAQEEVVDFLRTKADIHHNNDLALYTAAENIQPGIVKDLLSRGAKVDARGPGGQTALMAAIERWGESTAMVQAVADGTALTDLDFGAEGNSAKEVVQLLLDAGADINLQNERGENPLMNNYDDEELGIVKFILARHPKLDLKNEEGQTILHLAAAHNSVKIVGLLLDAKASVNVVDNEGRTPLMLAVDDGANDEARSRPTMHTASGAVPRHLPNPDGHPGMVKLLLDHGADPKIKAKDGSTALELAQKEKFQTVIGLLQGAKG